MVYNTLKTKRKKSNISSCLSHQCHLRHHLNLHDQHICDHHHHNHHHLVKAQVTPVSNLEIRICGTYDLPKLGHSRSIDQDVDNFLCPGSCLVDYFSSLNMQFLFRSSIAKCLPIIMNNNVTY